MKNEQSPAQRAALDTLADELEANLMPCPLGRLALLEFLRTQVSQLEEQHLRDTDAAWLIKNAYIQWVALALEQ